MKNINPPLPGNRFKQLGSHPAGMREKASLVHLNAITIHDAMMNHMKIY